jgi:hypothetical protein
MMSSWAGAVLPSSSPVAVTCLEGLLSAASCMESIWSFACPEWSCARFGLRNQRGRRAMSGASRSVMGGKCQSQQPRHRVRSPLQPSSHQESLSDVMQMYTDHSFELSASVTHSSLADGRVQTTCRWRMPPLVESAQ